MKWNRHPEYEGRHSFLSASQCHWLNYTPDKMISRFENEQAKQRGTELHEFASEAIRHKIKLLPGNTHPAVANFVNDAIGYRMDSEVLLFYSPYAFGTADAIRYEPPKKDNPRGFLRIHDLKTGVTKPKMEQLLVYAAYFCLEYGVKPEKTISNSVFIKVMISRLIFQKQKTCMTYIIQLKSSREFLKVNLNRKDHIHELGRSIQRYARA